jgi:hypothetical protein
LDHERAVAETVFGQKRQTHAKTSKDAKMNENVIGKAVVDAAVKVHRELGPGLLETVYEVVLAKEF